MFVKLVRIGKDAELKQSQSGKPFLNLSVVYDIGFGENKQSQWMSLVMFGQQAEKLAQHLTKGKQIVIRADELRTEVYQEKAYLKGTLLSVEFVSSGKQDAPAQDSHNTHKSNGYQKQQFDDDSDLPF